MRGCSPASAAPITKAAMTHARRPCSTRERRPLDGVAEHQGGGLLEVSHHMDRHEAKPEHEGRPVRGEPDVPEAGTEEPQLDAGTQKPHGGEHHQRPDQAKQIGGGPAAR